MSTAAPNGPTIRLQIADNVVIARAAIPAGTYLPDDRITATTRISPAYKIACRAIGCGEPVHRDEQPIGTASRAIAPDEHVHPDNLAMAEVERDYAFCRDARPTPCVVEPATFDGFIRAGSAAPAREPRVVV